MLTILCVATYFKGMDFLEECRRAGCTVLLLTVDSLTNAAWPREAIDEFFLIPNVSKQPDITYAISYLARDRQIDRMFDAGFGVYQDMAQAIDGWRVI